MADPVPAGGGQGIGAARGAGGDDDPPPRDNRSTPPGFQFKDWKGGNVNTSTGSKVSILDHDDLIITYLEESGMVLDIELKVYAIPANYVNPSESKMTALRSLMVHYNGMAVSRRKYLYLVVRGMNGEGCKGDNQRCEQILNRFLLAKGRVWEYLLEIKDPKPIFSRMPDIFKTLPSVKSKK